MKRTIRFAVLALELAHAFGQAKKAEKTDAQIKQTIIKESIAAYKGSCPCLTAGIVPVEVVGLAAPTANPAVLLRSAMRRTLLRRLWISIGRGLRSSESQALSLPPFGR